MKIIIPTYKRVENQVTLKSIPKDLLNLTYLVCYEEEEGALKKYNVNLIVVPKNIRGIGLKRQYIVDYFKEENILFIDDDLNFLKRLNGQQKLEKIDNITELYNWVSMCLDKGFGIVGCSAQAGNNRFKNNFTYFGRIWAFYGINTKILNKHNIRYDQIEVMEDFNVVLDLLRYGYRSIINTEFAHNQKASNQSGGCSETRTFEIQKRSALLLAEKHKPFVKVVKKKSKNWVNMEERYDVKIYWKKAFEQGNYMNYR